MKKNARIAGFWYLLKVIGSGYRWIYTSKVFVAENVILIANKK